MMPPTSSLPPPPEVAEPTAAAAQPTTAPAPANPPGQRPGAGGRPAWQRNRVFRFFSSVKLAVVLLIVVIIASAVGTVYESSFDAKVARAYVYEATWFNVWLLVLGLNLACAAFSRMPWKRHHTGFLITHLGIIVLLLGAVIGRTWGIEGTMTIFKGQPPNNQLIIDQHVLRLEENGLPLKPYPIFVIGRRPTGEKPWLLGYTPAGWKVELTDYAEHLNADFEPQAVPAAAASSGIGGQPAVHVHLVSKRLKQDMNNWLLAGDPEHGSLDLGLASVQLRRGVAPVPTPAPAPAPAAPVHAPPAPASAPAAAAPAAVAPTSVTPASAAPAATPAPAPTVAPDASPAVPSAAIPAPSATTNTAPAAPATPEAAASATPAPALAPNAAPSVVPVPSAVPAAPMPLPSVAPVAPAPVPSLAPLPSPSATPVAPPSPSSPAPSPAAVPPSGAPSAGAAFVLPLPAAAAVAAPGDAAVVVLKEMLYVLLEQVIAPAPAAAAALADPAAGMPSAPTSAAPAPAADGSTAAPAAPNSSAAATPVPRDATSGQPPAAPRSADALDETIFAFALKPGEQVSQPVPGSPASGVKVRFGADPARREIAVDWRGATWTFNTDADRGKPQDLSGSGINITIEGYWNDFVMQNGQPANASAETRNPAVMIRVTGKLPSVTADDPFADAGDNVDTNNPHGAAAASANPKSPSAENQAILYCDDAGVITFSLKTSASPELIFGKMSPGQPVNTGWADWQIQADQVMPQAVPQTTFHAVTAHGSGEGAAAAANGAGMGGGGNETEGVRVRLSRNGESHEEWIATGWKVAMPTSSQTTQLTYGFRQESLPVGLELTDFEVERQEGNDSPAAFKSTLRVSDAEGNSGVGSCSMNEPFNFPGHWWNTFTGLTYKVSQASWNPDNLAQSSVQILRDPGWTFKWIGSLLICSGIFTLFYLRPAPRGKGETKQMV